MSRKSTFTREEVGGIRGLTSLTEPDGDDPIGAVVDVAVIGARGDGKTQFIVHAIRTLRAYAPVLDGAEHQYNRDVLQVVMNAREPRPEATAPGVVPHYVFRIRAKSLLAQIGALARLALYARVANLWTYILLSLLNALFFWLALDWLGNVGRPALSVAAAAVFVLGALVGTVLSRQQFVRRGDIELVFWDVAGEHVYSHSAADYYSFLSALVRMRRRRASANRAYAFAPVLICNPVALGTRAQGSSYARLRKLIPLFASLNEPLARALIAINRWTVVKQVCAPDTDRREVIAIVPKARLSEDDLDELHAADLAMAARDGAEDGAEVTLTIARKALPVVKRDVVRKHCLDAEDGPDNDVHFTYLRYDAGMQCEFHERPYGQFEDLDDDARKRWRAPTASTPGKVVDYEYEDGPGAFEGDVRQVFLAWIAGLAFHEASYARAETRPARTVGEVAADMDMDVDMANTEDDDGAHRPRQKPVGDVKARSNAGGTEAAFVTARKQSQAARKNQGDSRNAWKPRALSATGLEDFARGTIVPDDWLANAIDASLRSEPAIEPPTPSFVKKSDRVSSDHADGNGGGNGKLAATIVDSPADADADADADDDADDDTDTSTVSDSAADSPLGPVEAARERSGTNPGFGSLDDMDAIRADSQAGPTDRAREPASDTLRMPGGFGSGGT